MRLRWLAADPAAVARCLGAVLDAAQAGVAPRVPQLRLRNAVIEVLAFPGQRGGDRLLVLDEGAGAASDDAHVIPEGSMGTLAAIGIATVDPERFAAERAWRTTPVAADAFLGASAFLVVAGSPPSAMGPRGDIAPPRLLLLEPNTEGRLAAALARRGEGPAALYLRPAGGVDHARRSLAAQGCRTTPGVAGPLGQAFGMGAAAWGPYVVLVGDDAASGGSPDAPA